MDNRKKRIRVLQVTGGLNKGASGGIASFLYTYYNEMDRERISFDFLTISHQCFQPYREKLEQFGSKLYCLDVEQFNSLKGIMTSVARFLHFLNDSQYDVIHINAGGLSVVLLCSVIGKLKGKGAKVIAHSHSSMRRRGLHDLSTRMLKPLLTLFGDCFLACSTSAAEHMFSRGVIKNKRHIIISNAIDGDKFRYDEQTREEYRAHFGIGNELLVGHVGRAAVAKNHGFLLEIFHEIKKRNTKAKLILVGAGQLESSIKQQVNQLGLTDDVIFTGHRKDVNKIMQAMDVMVLPSLFEGLGIVAIEAQAAGLPVIASDVFPSVVNISEWFVKMSLRAPAEKWSSAVLRMVDGHIRENATPDLSKYGFDIKESVKELESVYFSLA